MKELTYKSANKILFYFRKNAIWQRSITSPRFSENNIKVTSTMFSDAIDKYKCEEGLWRVEIDWSKVDMKCREVSLTICVSYSGAAKITEDVIIRYPVRTVSSDDFDISLSPQTAMWGTEGKVCTLDIHLKPWRKSWMYVDSSFRLGLNTMEGRGFHPLANDLSMPFQLKDGCSIDLEYVGYDTEKPIKDNEIRNLGFVINGVNVGKPLAFTFTPRPYSYRFEVIKTKEKYYYGDSDRKLFRIQLVREDPLSPIADIVNLGFECETMLCVKENEYIEVKPEVNYEELLNGVNDTLICDIDEGKCKLREEIEMGGVEKQAKNYVRVVPGVKPDLQFIQNGKVLKADQKLLFYCGENNECELVIKNNCDKMITISAISVVLASDNSSELFKIEPKEESRFTIKVDTSVEIEDHVLVTVWTKETESATINYGIIIKERPHALITIEPIEVEEKDRLVVGNAYLMGWYCLTRCLVGYDKNSPFDSEEIDLKEIGFDTNYQLSDKDTKKGLIPKNKREEVNLMFKVPEYFKNDDKIVIKDNQYFLECNWEYHGQSGAIQVPVIMPKLYGKKLSFFQDKNEIVFPKPDEGRVIKVFECTFRDLNDKDSGIRWDRDQKLSVESPFSFSDSEIVKEKAITPGDVVPFYLHVNEIDGIDENTKNINERIIVSLCSTMSAKNHPSEPLFMYGIIGAGKKEKVNPEIVLLPIEAKAKRQVLCRANDDETRLIKNSRTPVSIRIQQQAEDVEALLVGELVVRNVEEIPYKNNGVRFIVKTLSLKDNNKEILHPMTVCPSSCITILNGEPEVSFPIYIDYQKWKEIISDENLVMRFELSPIKEAKENNNDGKGEDDTIYYEVGMEIIQAFIDDVYSLDLGTTGIVVAKEIEDSVECVILEDVDNPIERDEEILSSHTMITVKETGNGDEPSKETAIELAPPADEYYGTDDNDKRFRLVPSKFIIGQEKIPFLSSFYGDNSISKQVKLFNINKSIDISLTGTKQDGKNISELISCLYKEIFYRMNKEIDKVKKLVITYPNTYTIDNLNAIKSIMVEDLGLKKNGQISFVPESDAVAAYYFDQKIVFDNGFLDEKGKPVAEETVVFYDMGAGTLDLSLVKFKRKGEDGFVANIINKIGIPLAGNYLDYIIFKTLRDGGWIKQRMEEKHNAIKELTLDIKVNYKKDTPIGDLRPTWLTENSEYFDNLEEFKKKTYKRLFGDAIAGFLIACSKTVLKCLIPNGEKVNVVVFSGRGSRFLPLREKVVEHLKKMGNNSIKEIQLRNTNNGDCMKTCVAIGALRYQSYFNSDGPFKIENKNLYSKMAIVYWGKEKGKYDVVVRYLIDPLKEDWEGVEVINGTQCKEFFADETISNFIPGKMMYYIQTCLDEGDLKDLYRKLYQNDSSAKDDLNWAFVNLLFKKRVGGNEPISVKLRISKENIIVERIIGGDVFTEVKLLENVEDSLLYRRSMWPFITKLD